MTRIITPREIKPGMRIRWTYDEVTHECTVRDCNESDTFGGVLFHVTDQSIAYVYGDTPEITVLSELPAQPKEPTVFGARVVVDGRRFVRVADENDHRPWRHLRARWWVDWQDVCALGQVTIVEAAPSWDASKESAPSEESPARPAPWAAHPARLQQWDTWEDVPVCTHVHGAHGAVQYCKAADGTVSIKGVFIPEWREMPRTPERMDELAPFTPATGTAPHAAPRTHAKAGQR